MRTTSLQIWNRPLHVSERVRNPAFCAEGADRRIVARCVFQKAGGVMNYRRSGVNYIFWAMYGLTVCAALTVQAKSVCLLWGRGEVWWYLPAAGGCILLLFLVLFLPSRLICGKWGGKKDSRRAGHGRSRLAEGGYLALLIAVSLALRLLQLREAGAAGLQDAAVTLTAFAGFPFAALTFSSLSAWLKLLLSACAESGIRAAGLLPPLYETLGILLLYPALRSLAGRFPAALVTAVLAFLPVFPGLSAAGGPDGFFLTAAAVLLLFSSFYVKCFSLGNLSLKRPSPGKNAAACAVLCGFPAGAAAFLDSAFFPFLLFPIWASFLVLPAEGPLRRNRRMRKKEQNPENGQRAGSGLVVSRKRKAAGTVVLLLSAVLGYAALLALQTWISGEGPVETLAGKYGFAEGFSGRLWIENRVSEDMSAGGISFLLAERGILWLIPVVCFCVLYIFGFFDQKGNVGSVWLPSFLLSTVLCFSAREGEAKWTAAFFCWLVMAAMGLHSAFFREERRKRRRKDPEEAVAASAAALENGEKKTEHELLPGEPIPNPLPVPKKRAHREMDYAYEPGEDEMFFDIDQVEEGDDFDYQ